MAEESDSTPRIGYPDVSWLAPADQELWMNGEAGFASVRD